ncbi:MAG: biotin--[acetyl-CoA-carboxylase] ligase [Massilibacteroides sp.]|nr:biotin--[acetyl-CoA-carboxylase] ligase [Massilibacteroides sp.]
MQTDLHENEPVIIRIRETASTNSELRKQLAEQSLPEGSLIIAEHQTQGRGQVGNSWESEPGKNLTFSLVIYPDIIAANEQFLISQVTALSVKKTLSEYVEDITVKWPNDIYWKDRKICGMLIENDLCGRNISCSICGIGININQKKFYSDAPNPVSLVQITGQKYDLEKLLSCFRHHFYDFYLQLLLDKKQSIQQSYRESLYRGKGFHTYSDEKGIFEAEIEDVEPTGHLLLRLKNEEIRRYAFKEVSIK